ncbi:MULTISPECIES: ABC transporter permease [unclassified Rathayibacter]|uniref:ABC transporter permease n=1 Tax=unclassified Rathayibacter TaxID=2609250 RepID=UPI00132F3F7D|nr:MULTISPECIES: ABC transporter permease [unclassified Rathayibacter]MCJ1674016.1 ABC transporter permease [Rathayibacter sp. VKM Ac-2929]MCJ1685190.1 ABC transporter permease [Rathayibacter sp. VKM Ac-2928]MCJ1689218.1 ABC transporter permease [Rathayibacter sp. VKM Ac-2927]QHF23044.1 ABC transporter permease subunit [Rathayibacter sp. VKM Ac-2804]
MGPYLVRRLAQGLATIFAVVTIAFGLGRLSGSPAALLLTENATPEQIADLNQRLGFDLPLWQQYLRYLGGLLTGDFGDSYRQAGVSSMQLVLERLPASLSLGAVGLLLGLALALVAGVVIQLTRSRGLRALSLGLGSTRQAIPDFFFGLLLVLVLSVWLGLLPSLGNRDPLAIIMPALTIATGQFVLYTRLLDNALTEQSTQDYARTAFARGENRFRVVVGELLPNAFLPVLTVAGISLGSFLGGLVIVENVFAWPGMGQLMLGAVYSRDFPVVQSGLIVVALLFILANLLVDVVSGLIDPRVRLA